MKDESNPLKPTIAENTSEVVAIGLNAVPVVGGILAAAATSVIAKRQNRRLEEFLQELVQDLNDIKHRMNNDFVLSDDFEDLVEDIFSKASETKQKAKLEAFRNIFLNTVLAQHPNYDEATELAKLVDNWQERHIVLLQILANPLKADNSVGNVVGRGGSTLTTIDQILGKLLPGWDSDQIERTWQDLYDARIHTTQGTRTMMTDSGIHQLEGRLSSFGRKVAKFIQSP